jgi:hypothetical protein
MCNKSFECSEVQIFGNNPKKNIVFKEKLGADWAQGISFGPESFAFYFAIQKYEDWNTQNDNFDGCLIWLWNLASHTEGGT